MEGSAWYYESGGGQAGPVDDRQIADLLANGTITSETLVWREGLLDWVPASAAGIPERAPSPEVGSARAESSPGKKRIGSEYNERATLSHSNLGWVAFFACLGVLVLGGVAFVGYLALVTEQGVPETADDAEGPNSGDSKFEQMMNVYFELRRSKGYGVVRAGKAVCSQAHEDDQFMRLIAVDPEYQAEEFSVMGSMRLRELPTDASIESVRIRSAVEKEVLFRLVQKEYEALRVNKSDQEAAWQAMALAGGSTEMVRRLTNPSGSSSHQAPALAAKTAPTEVELERQQTLLATPKPESRTERPPVPPQVIESQPPVPQPPDSTPESSPPTKPPPVVFENPAEHKNEAATVYPPNAHVITFESEEDRGKFRFNSGDWRIKEGELVASCEKALSWATYHQAFRKIRSVTIVGRIVPPSTNEFRFWIGPIHACLNWSEQNVNRYRNNKHAYTETRPHVLTPGKEHRIELRQDGPQISCLVDGKVQYVTTGNLSGTVSVQAAWGSTIAIRKIVIDGDVEAGRRVQAETRDVPRNK